MVARFTITSTSSTYRCQRFGFVDIVDMASSSSLDMKMFAMMGETGEPMASPLDIS